MTPADDRTESQRPSASAESAGSRAAVLTRIREALRAEARPGPSTHRDFTTAKQARETLRDLLPPGGTPSEERFSLLAANLEKLRAAFHRCRSVAEAGAILDRLCEVEGWRAIATHEGEMTNDVLAAVRHQSAAEDQDSRSAGDAAPAILRVDRGYEAEALEACDAAVTECDCLVVQFGCACVSTRSAGGRALSVLPPHHIILARQHQVVGDLLEAFALLRQKYGGQWPGMVGLIAGPSRTGDIERILVLGAHGPKRLTILLLP